MTRQMVIFSRVREKYGGDRIVRSRKANALREHGKGQGAETWPPPLQVYVRA
jgi:hypothetical protein